MLRRRGSGTEATFPTNPTKLCWARRKSRNLQCSTHPAKTLGNLPILAPPGDHQGAPVVSFALRDLALLLTQLFLPPPPFIETVTCPEMKSFILLSSHLWDVFALKTSCHQFLISDQLGRAVFLRAGNRSTCHPLFGCQGHFPGLRCGCMGLLPPSASSRASQLHTKLSL